MTKEEIARRQLGTALSLFLKDADPVSVHSLAVGGGEIAGYLASKVSKEAFSAHALATIPELDSRKLRRLRNQYWNAFKHAATHDDREREDTALLAAFSDEQNDHALLVGWYDYMIAVGHMPIEAQAFQMWYFAKFPEKLNSSVSAAPYQALFPALASLSRAGQKERLRFAISGVRSNPDIMNDRRTDPRPLILGTSAAPFQPQGLDA